MQNCFTEDIQRKYLACVGVHNASMSLVFNRLAPPITTSYLTWSWNGSCQWLLHLQVDKTSFSFVHWLLLNVRNAAIPRGDTLVSMTSWWNRMRSNKGWEGNPPPLLGSRWTARESVQRQKRANWLHGSEVLLWCRIDMIQTVRHEASAEDGGGSSSTLTAISIIRVEWRSAVLCLYSVKVSQGAQRQMNCSLTKSRHHTSAC